MFHFVANLKPYLVHRGSGNRRFDAYLLSVDYARSLDGLAHFVAKDDRILAGDNGNVDLITDLISAAEPEVKPLLQALGAEEGQLGHYARPGEVSRELRDRFRKFAADVRTATREATPAAYVRATVEAQRALPARYLIGMEELSIAVLTGLSAEPEYTQLPLSWYAKSTETALGHAERMRGGDYGPVNSAVFAALHAIDYDTAVQAGRLAGAANVDGIATGMAGILKDRNFVDFRVAGGELHELGATAPRPYMRTLDVAAGMQLGHAEETGRRVPFHALGAGSPILLPLLGLLGDAKTFSATDSTAPILDAYSSYTISLYVDRPAPLKLKAHRIAEYWIAGGPGWDCACPFCAAFNRAHPPQLAKAKAWCRAQGKTSLSAADLRGEASLAEYLPLLGSHPEPEIRAAAGSARIGHNHWTVQRLEREIRRASTSSSRLRSWVAGVVDDYLESSASDLWRAATEAAWKVADETAAKLADADPGRGFE